MMLIIAAWVAIVLTVINLLATPALMGKDRGVVTYVSFITAIISAAIILPLAFHALGWL